MQGLASDLEMNYLFRRQFPLHLAKLLSDSRVAVAGTREQHPFSLLALESLATGRDTLCQRVMFLEVFLQKGETCFTKMIQNQLRIDYFCFYSISFFPVNVCWSV